MDEKEKEYTEKHKHDINERIKENFNSVALAHTALCEDFKTNVIDKANKTVLEMFEDTNAFRAKFDAIICEWMNRNFPGQAAGDDIDSWKRAGKSGFFPVFEFMFEQDCQKITLVACNMAAHTFGLSLSMYNKTNKECNKPYDKDE